MSGQRSRFQPPRGTCYTLVLIKTKVTRIEQSFAGLKAHYVMYFNNFALSRIVSAD